MSRFLEQIRWEHRKELVARWRMAVSARGKRLVSRVGETSLKSKLVRLVVSERPPMAITPIQPPALLVLMGGTTVRQYDQAGQFGRLSVSLERHAKFFRSVVLMTADRTDFTRRIENGRVRHLKMRLPVPTGVVSLLLSVVFRFRTVRRMTSIVILDEQAAPAAWLASLLSGSPVSMSVGAPWAPPRDPDVGGVKRWLVRRALRRVGQVVEWHGTESSPATPDAETIFMPSLVDTDLYCPLTTTDPARPRTVGVFLGAGNEEGARVIIGVAGRLARRGHGAAIRVLVGGQSADSRAAMLQAEVGERGLDVEFLAMPPAEMLPDAIGRMRVCVAFNDAESVLNLQRAMASGVPGIAIEPGSQSTIDDPSGPDWTCFVLRSGSNEEDIARCIETLFREPGVRLRLAREGRRFVIAKHSLEAIATRESELLLGTESSFEVVVAREPEFDAAAEAEKLAQMLEMVGVARIDSNEEAEREVTA